MRPRVGGAPELLMMERPGHMAFAAGALVFPGGRIEEEDRRAAADLADGSDLAAAKIAAVRETLEETGIAAGLSPQPTGAALAALRGPPAPDGGFARLLADNGLTLALDALVPVRALVPQFQGNPAVRRDLLPGRGAARLAEPVALEGEAVRAFWASADDVLAQIDAGAAQAIFPTRRNLERLALFATFEEACADAARHEVRTITPWVERRETGSFVCIPDDAGYP
jgi:8-oxo-dGTP pyrophosphatase MutT (NUDIX family)